VLASFILIRFLPAWTIAVWLGVINLLILLMVLKRRHLFSYQAAFFLLLGWLVLILAGGVGEIERWSRSFQWQGYEIVDVVDSQYGNLALVKRGGEFSLYENGLLSFTTGDDLAAENNVHFALLAHPDPYRVLLIGNGLNGALQEILKYPRTTIDYVELDARLLELAHRYLPAKITAPLDDPRITVIYQDARRYVKLSSPQVYDVVLVNLSDPYTAFLNRYYTLEFYWEVSRILKPDGFLGFSVSSSENYLNQETRAFLQSLYTTAGQVFKQVHIIPGETNVFLATRSAERVPMSADFFAGRLRQRDIRTKYVHPSYLPFRLNGMRVNQLRKAVLDPGRLNTDMRPIAFLYDIVLWSTHFNSVFRNLISRLQGLTLIHLMLVPLAIFLIGAAGRNRNRMLPVQLSIAVTGFSEIIYQIIVIVAFQVLYGYVYYKVGLIVTFFMIGLVAGGWLVRRCEGQPLDQVYRSYIWVQAGIVIYPLLLPPIFHVFRHSVVIGQAGGVLGSLFSALPVAAGLMGGMQYVLAVQMKSAYDSDKTATARSSGLLYALDVLGSTLGALLAGAILIPLLGINALALFCVVLNGVVFILLLGNKKTAPSGVEL